MTGAWSFNFFYSLPFWLALFVTVPLVRLLSRKPRLQEAFLLATSVAFLLAIPRFTLVDLALVAGFAVTSYGTCLAIARHDPVKEGRRRLSIATLGVLAILAFLSIFKFRILQDLVAGRGLHAAPSSDPVSLLGVSYMSFKAIAAVVDTYKGTLSGLDALRFVNYVAFFPAFVSGPINRYQQFAGYFAGPRDTGWKDDLRVGGRRILDGLFKKFVLVTLVFPHVLPTDPAALAVFTPGKAVVSLYATALYFYFDFSGYSDLAIGSARLMGIPLPENFNWPFLQRNIRDLWSNWHMSLTTWLIEYVYWPVVRKLRNFQFFKPRPLLLSVAGMNVTFVACGLWHGESLHYVVWGLYHGMGISLLQVYQRWKRRIPSRRLQRYFASPYSRWVGALGTFHFFAAGIALFQLDLGRLAVLLRAVFS